MSDKRTIIIIEGARGAGKTSLVSEIRKRNSEMISMNLTGTNKDESETGYDVLQSYQKTIQYITSMASYGYNIVLDRFHFSEAVYSALYKNNYSFEKETNKLNECLGLSESAELNIVVILLTVTKEQLEERLKIRKEEGAKDKLFGNVSKADSVGEALKQQELYKKVINQFSEQVGGNKRGIMVKEIPSGDSIGDNYVKVIDAINTQLGTKFKMLDKVGKGDIVVDITGEFKTTYKVLADRLTGTDLIVIQPYVGNRLIGYAILVNARRYVKYNDGTGVKFGDYLLIEELSEEARNDGIIEEGQVYIVNGWDIDKGLRVSHGLTIQGYLKGSKIKRLKEI